LGKNSFRSLYNSHDFIWRAWRYQVTYFYRFLCHLHQRMSSVTNVDIWLSITELCFHMCSFGLDLISFVGSNYSSLSQLYQFQGNLCCPISLTFRDSDGGLSENSIVTDSRLSS
jgi:hypothetical protein